MTCSFCFIILKSVKKDSVHNVVYYNNQLAQSPNTPPITKADQPTYGVASSSNHRQRHSNDQSKARLLKIPSTHLYMHIL